jgi:CHAT domain
MVPIGGAHLLAVLRTELAGIASRTVALAAGCAFARTRDGRHGIVTALHPTPRELAAAQDTGRRLRHWAAVVASVLRRRGIATPTLLSLIDQLANLVLLRRRDRAAIRETEWRRGFDHETETLRIALDDLLIRTSGAFRSQSRIQDGCDLFHVRVERKDHGRWRIEAAADAGPTVEMVIAPPSKEIARFLATYCGPDRMKNADAAPSTLEPMVQFGQRLHHAVLGGAIATRFKDARERARAHGRMLRLQLTADSVAEVPWEILHDGVQFLCLTDDVFLTRTIADANAGRRGDASASLRILLTISSPRGLAAIDEVEERRTIEDALSARCALGLAQLDVAPDGSLSTFRRMLREADREGRPYDCWHFAGHGEYNSLSQRCVIAMTAAAGDIHWVGGHEFATLFAGVRSPRLVVLKSCEGASGIGGAAWSALVSSLIASGVSTVVAMSFELSYDASTVFDDAFYGAIADGVTVDEAVAEARRAILDRPNFREWITPAVFRAGGEVRWLDSALP